MVVVVVVEVAAAAAAAAAAVAVAVVVVVVVVVVKETVAAMQISKVINAGNQSTVSDRSAGAAGL